jgi:hypothetical protein
MFESFLNEVDHDDLGWLLDDCCDCEHTVSGKLLSGGQHVAGKQIIVKVNGTVLGDTVTLSDGSYSGTLYLPAVDDKPTNYQVEFAFYGDNAQNLTGYAFLPNGTRYAVCTTLQYFSYKPAANCTWLTVEPQAAHATTATKTPEQLQQEAEQSGWLKPPEPRFSWEYPFFRLHFIAVVANEDVLDVGLSILGCDIVSMSSLFGSWLEDAVKDLIIYPIVKAYFIGWILSEITLFAATYAGPFGFLGDC